MDIRCRVCLSSSDAKLYHPLSATFPAYLKSPLSVLCVLQRITFSAVLIVPGWPHEICTSCLKCLKDCDVFIKQFHKAQAVLMESVEKQTTPSLTNNEEEIVLKVEPLYYDNTPDEPAIKAIPYQNDPIDQYSPCETGSLKVEPPDDYSEPLFVKIENDNVEFYVNGETHSTLKQEFSPEKLQQSSSKQTKKISSIKKQTNQINKNTEIDIRISEHNYTKDPYWQKEIMKVNCGKSVGTNGFRGLDVIETKNVVETMEVRKSTKRKSSDPTKKSIKKPIILSVKENMLNVKRGRRSQLPLAVRLAPVTQKPKVIEAIQPSTDPLKVQITKKIKNQTKKLVDAGQNFKCNLCPKAFSTLQGFMLHKPVHIPEYINKLKCDTCGLQCNSKTGLICHRRIHSRVIGGVRQLGNHNKKACSKCGRKFKFISSLKRHMTDTHGDENEALLCSFCGDKFISRDLLQSHMSCHGTIMQYSCEFCPASFNSYIQLQTHYYLGHQRR